MRMCHDRVRAARDAGINMITMIWIKELGVNVISACN